MNDFWDEFSNAFVIESAMDKILQGKPLEGEQLTSMRALTDKAKQARHLQLPVEAGTRVQFLANLGSVLTYDDIPPGCEGTVVKVKSAAGKTTAWEGRVFVQWDDGQFRSILAEHLRPASINRRTAKSVAFKCSNLGDLSSYFSVVRTANDELVHRATKDLWSFSKGNDGNYVIERLFNFDGTPLKI